MQDHRTAMLDVTRDAIDQADEIRKVALTRPPDFIGTPLTLPTPALRDWTFRLLGTRSRITQPGHRSTLARAIRRCEDELARRSRVDDVTHGERAAAWRAALAEAPSLRPSVPLELRADVRCPHCLHDGVRCCEFGADQ